MNQKSFEERLQEVQRAWREFVDRDAPRFIGGRIYEKRHNSYGRRGPIKDISFTNGRLLIITEITEYGSPDTAWVEQLDGDQLAATWFGYNVILSGTTFGSVLLSAPEYLDDGRVSFRHASVEVELSC